MAEILRGNLGAISLSGLLQLAESEYLCGELRLSSGTLALHNGALTEAHFLGLEGMSAAVEALVRARGGFALVPAEVPTTPIAGAMALVLESCRIQDELERLGPMVATAKSDEAPDPALAPMLPLLDGQRTLAAALVASGLAVARAIDPLLEAWEGGALEVHSTADQDSLDILWVDDGPVEIDVEPVDDDAASARPAAEPAVNPAVPTEGRSFDDLIFDARKHTRRREFDEAEALLLAALDLRPGDRIAAQNLSRIRSLRAAAAA